MAVRTSITISEDSKKRAEEIKNALPFLKSFGAVVEYCITYVHEELASNAGGKRKKNLARRILGKRGDKNGIPK